MSNGAGGKYGALRVDAMLYKCVNENAGQCPAIRTPSGGEPPFVKGGAPTARGIGSRIGPAVCIANRGNVWGPVRTGHQT